jgi:hypothetical protein
MWKLQFDLIDGKHFVETETEQELLSVALDAFNHNALFYHVYKDDKIIYSFKEIYQKINKAYY